MRFENGKESKIGFWRLKNNLYGSLLEEEGECWAMIELKGPGREGEGLIRGVREGVVR